MKNIPIYMASSLQLEASTDPTLPRKFAGVAYSGGAVNEWGEQLIIDLETATVAPSMPLLLQHDHCHVIGAISSATIANGSLSVSGELFSDIDEHAASVAAKSQRGAAYQMSIGIFDCSRETVAAGQQITVNGQTFSSPVTVLRNGNIREVSIVALGADANTNVAIFSKQSEPNIKENHTMANQIDAAAEIVALKEEIAILKEEAKAAGKKLEAQATAARTEDVRQLLAVCKEEMTEELC